jgi:ribosome-associated heat shock protein Hsp15
MDGQRLDKWLWYARLVKTRSGAARLIEAGKVRINGTRALKPSRLAQAGDVVTATPLGKVSVVRVLASTKRRGPASLARTLYEDLTPQLWLRPSGGRAVGLAQPSAIAGVSARFAVLIFEVLRLRRRGQPAQGAGLRLDPPRPQNAGLVAGRKFVPTDGRKRGLKGLKCGPDQVPKACETDDLRRH